MVRTGAACLVAGLSMLCAIRAMVGKKARAPSRPRLWHVRSCACVSSSRRWRRGLQPVTGALPPNSRHCGECHHCHAGLPASAGAMSGTAVPFSISGHRLISCVSTDCNCRTELPWWAAKAGRPHVFGRLATCHTAGCVDYLRVAITACVGSGWPRAVPMPRRGRAHG